MGGRQWVGWVAGAAWGGALRAAAQRGAERAACRYHRRSPPVGMPGSSCLQAAPRGRAHSRSTSEEGLRAGLFTLVYV